MPIDKIEWRISTLLALILISGEKQGSSVEGFLTLMNDKKMAKRFQVLFGQLFGCQARCAMDDPRADGVMGYDRK